MNPKDTPTHADTSDQFKRVETDVVSTMLNGELVMMNVNTGDYFGIENTALTIWERLSKPVSLSELVTELTQRYEIDENNCRREVLMFLNQLEDHKLLKTITGNTPSNTK